MLDQVSLNTSLFRLPSCQWFLNLMKHKDFCENPDSTHFFTTFTQKKSQTIVISIIILTFISLWTILVFPWKHALLYVFIFLFENILLFYILSTLLLKYIFVVYPFQLGIFNLYLTSIYYNRINIKYADFCMMFILWQFFFYSCTLQMFYSGYWNDHIVIEDCRCQNVLFSIVSKYI